MSGMTPEEKTEVPGPGDDSKIWRYTARCVARYEQNALMLIWDDGEALETTKGASIDYIPKHMYMHINADSGVYAPHRDIEAMMNAGLPASLALTVVSMRQNMISLFRSRISEKPKVNASECVFVDRDRAGAPLTDAQSGEIERNSTAISNVVQMTFTIAAMNGIGLITQGHHYVDTQSSWASLDRATGILANIEQISGRYGADAAERVIYHDALHPFSYDWIASLAANPASPILANVHGTASIRIPTIPAGVTVVPLLIALVEFCKSINAEFAAGLAPLVVVLKQFQANVQNRPLDYCVHFKRDALNQAKDQIDTFKRIAATLAGFVRQAVGDKSTIMKSRALRTIESQYAPEAQMGRALAGKIPVSQLSAREIQASFSELLNRIGVEWDMDLEHMAQREAARPEGPA
jgi:hypothetical protein